ncbi:hypothetical protein BKK79_01050 [Cupriavidus sp. USMAA2-4]|nr:hypothetical protein [Cupriavidus sp. USMAA2-4]AOY90573.1 hypothetical protein BKK79_01050 [Cupriavidus sp. USMAA2-4]
MSEPSAPPPPSDSDGYRYYVLDEAGRPVRVEDLTVHIKWVSGPGKAFRLEDKIPEHNVTVCTYFPGNPSPMQPGPPQFWTCIQQGTDLRIFCSPTWEEAQDKHRRVLEKARRVLPYRKMRPE